MLEFVYAPSNTTPPASGQTGDYASHLKEVDLLAATPSGSPPTSFSVTRTAVEVYAYDSNGRLAAAWDPRVSSALSDCTPSPCQPLKETYTYDGGGRLQTIVPAGLNAWSMTYTTVGPDPSGGRLASVNRATPIQDGSTQTATTSVAYNVPLSGSSAPYQMDAPTLDATGQTDIPVDATAVFPPDQVPASPPTSYNRATVYYLDPTGRTVNVAQPGGRIATTEYDSSGNVIRELSAANRGCALSSTCDSSWLTGTSTAKSRALDTQRTYQSNNVDIADEWGPTHKIELADGSTTYARRHLHNAYNYASAPSPTTDYHVVTSSTVGAVASVGGTDLAGTDRVTAYGYGGAENSAGNVAPGQSNVGWTLRRPTTVTTDSGGLNLVSATLYDAATGRVTETRMPRSKYGGDASATQSLYYVAGTNGSDSACGSSGNRQGWDGMLCETRPAAQPTSSLPAIPSITIEYNQLGLETKRTDTAGSSSRTWTTGYDAAGRKSSYAVSSSVGTTLPGLSYTYTQASGLPATDADGTRTISRGYDAIGRITSYTDADGQQSTTTYDLLSRPVVTNDGKGTQTRTYDTSLDSRGLLTRIVDSQAGAFNASYDDDGRPVTETYPNGLIACTSYDETGDATELAYHKSSDCLTGSVWLDDKQTSSVHGQWLHHEDQQLNGSSQDYTYDAAGRLTLTKDTVSGACTTRAYEFDNSTGDGRNSNRTKLTTRVSTNSTCDTTSAGNVTNYQYDEADREKDTGFSYDAFGRTTAIPAARGGTATSATYFTNDRMASLTQGTTTRSYALDPDWRTRQRTASDTTTQTYHYSDDSDSPSWTQDKPNGANPPYTRNVEGPDGNLAALVVSGTATLQLTDLHGDVVATATTSTSATGPSATQEADEFGVPRSSAGYRYGWLGGKERRTELSTGAVAMGQRLYIPQLGRFAQTDPVPGGSANDYDYVNQDPLDLYDLEGQCIAGPLCKVVKKVVKFVGGVLAIHKIVSKINIGGTVQRYVDCGNKLLSDLQGQAGVPPSKRNKVVPHACNLGRMTTGHPI